jgi:hypothetical protein
MATDKQIAANRRNAQRSTGPKTVEGKAHSSRNALVHGMTAKRLLIDGESPEDYEALKAGIWEEFEIVGTLEEEVANRLVQIMFRLRRVPAFEAAILQWLDRFNSCMHNDDDGLLPGVPMTRIDHPGEDAPLEELLAYGNEKLGRTLEKMMKSGDMLGRIAGYEMRLVRLYRETLVELRDLIAERKENERKASEAAEIVHAEWTAEGKAA